jgi:hypothetical protein
MRAAVLIVGILGALAAGTLGFLWYQQKNSPEAQLVELLRTKVDKIDEKGKAALAEYDRLVMAIWFLFAAVPLGIAGAILGFTGRGLAGAALMLLAVIGPTVLVPKSLLFTSVLIIAALLSFFVKRPQAAPSGLGA